MATLGAKPLNPTPPKPAAEPEPPDTEESRQFDAELEERVQHLKALDPADEHFASDMTDAVDLLSSHIGGWEQGDQLKSRIKQATAAKARAALSEHLAWAEQSFPPGVDRVGAQLHGLGLYVDDLDPIHDAQTIEIARRLLPSVDHD